MKYTGWIYILLLILACSDKKVTPPEEGQLRLQLAATEIGRFGEYIHSLGIYAFRQTAGGKFVYATTLAELNAAEIATLPDASGGNQAKYFTANLKVGTYELYAAGNAAGKIRSSWTEGVTTPEEVILEGNPEGQDSIYFLGFARVTLVSSYMPAVKITLNRAVSKLVLVLYGVPVEVERIGISLGNVATGVQLNGQTTSGVRTYEQQLIVRQDGNHPKDTLVTEMILLPSGTGGSDFRLIFYAANGQEKVREMPRQTLLPDKYIRVSGKINEQPGGLLDFGISMNILLVDYWLDRTFPDFTLTPPEV